jgi:hypothetical protein
MVSPLSFLPINSPNSGLIFCFGLLFFKNVFRKVLDKKYIEMKLEKQNSIFIFKNRF